jgi:hypothetical protein
MEDQHSQHSTQGKLNIIKLKRLVKWLKTAGLSNTTNHKNPILKYEGLGSQLMHAASEYQREKAYLNKMVKGQLPCFPLAAIQGLLFVVLNLLEQWNI